MIEALDTHDGEDDEPLIEIYGGATFRDVDTRIEEDKTGGKSMLQERLRLPLEPLPDFKGYVFHEVGQLVEGDGMLPRSLIRLWRSQPWL